MTAQAFNIAANAPQPYVFDLKSEVAAFYRDHPEQKKKIFFVDASTLPGAVEYGDKKDEDEVAALLSHNGDLIINNQKAMKSGSRSDKYPDLGYGCVMLNLSKPN